MADALPGRPSPLGATPRDGGTNFAVASSVAEAAEVCLFDDAGTETRFRLPDYDGGAWHGFLPGVVPGQAYGFRVHGPYDAARGLRCNPAKLLLDPYARAVRGDVSFGPEVFDYSWDDHDAPSSLDSAGHVPLSLVTDAAFDWGSDAPPRRDYADTILYEVHVKGFTMRHPASAENCAGPTPGWPTRPSCHICATWASRRWNCCRCTSTYPTSSCCERGLTNYWGYNTIGYFAPTPRTRPRCAPGTRRAGCGVQGDGAARCTPPGIEVMLDVVYNHTAEGGEGGPTLCLRGLDNAAYYRLTRTTRAVRRHHRLRQLAERRRIRWHCG